MAHQLGDIGLIRYGHKQDIGRLIEMTDALRSEVAPTAPFDPEYTKATFVQYMENQWNLVLVLDLGLVQGMLVAVAQRYPFAPILAADEVMWYVEPENRGHWRDEFLVAYEEWCRKIGAKLLGLNTTGKDAGPLYERQGCVRGETKYYRTLN